MLADIKASIFLNIIINNSFPIKHGCGITRRQYTFNQTYTTGGRFYAILRLNAADDDKAAEPSNHTAGRHDGNRRIGGVVFIRVCF